MTQYFNSNERIDSMKMNTLEIELNKMSARSILLPNLETKPKAFFGLGFGRQGVPIDVLPIYLLSCFIPDFSLLVVDEFLKLNGQDLTEIEFAKNRLLDTIQNLNKVYSSSPNILFCSDFMHLGEYLKIFK